MKEKKFKFTEAELDALVDRTIENTVHQILTMQRSHRGHTFVYATDISKWQIRRQQRANRLRASRRKK